MLNLRFWLRDQGLSVRELAGNLDVPVPTVEDWVYRGTTPSQRNAEMLSDFISATCTHHWVIEAANGPLSEGVCQRCGEERGFKNSPEATWFYSARSGAVGDSATELKES